MLGNAPPTAHLVAVLACGVGSALSAKYLLALVALVRPIAHEAAFIARYLIALGFFSFWQWERKVSRWCALLLLAYRAVVSFCMPISVVMLWLQLPLLVLARAEVR